MASSQQFRTTCPPESVCSSSVAEKINYKNEQTTHADEDLTKRLVQAFTYPLHFLFLLLAVVLLPLLLHIIQELLSIDKELFALLLLPRIDLGLQSLFKLATENSQKYLMPTFLQNMYIEAVKLMTLLREVKSPTVEILWSQKGEKIIYSSGLEYISGV